MKKKNIINQKKVLFPQRRFKKIKIHILPFLWYENDNNFIYLPKFLFSEAFRKVERIF
jgi:hypothetical protein